MALLLAPYNASMRLGSGFNSYTQQLCIDNAVVRDQTYQHSESASSPPDSAAYDKQDVAQSVIFKTEIIQKMSDLTDALDINGALSIKASNIANARGNGSFVNSNVIKESDMNFLITCKVINQVIHDESLTKFVPLANTAGLTFADVFGDSFISGFQVGGEFTALISIKVHDKSQLQSISAQAEIAFTTPNFISKEDAIAAEEKQKKQEEAVTVASADSTVATAEKTDAGKSVSKRPDTTPKPAAQKGLAINADAKIQKDRAEILSQNTVTISVAWTGGGQELKATNEDWNFETLRAAAIKFPELVAKTPVRTHAILTKYTALRSYYQSLNKSAMSSPVSYENSSVYTTMLQDAYLDYKNLYKDLQLLGMDVDQGKKTLKPGQGLIDNTQKLADKTDKQPKTKKTEEPTDIDDVAVQSVEETRVESLSDESVITPETEQDLVPHEDESKKTPPPPSPPVKPFDVDKPYDATLMGLEIAKHDIRINMSRILLEVDAIAKTPNMVLDEKRPLTFMSPLLFKQFVPRGTVVDDTQSKTE